MQGSQGRIQDLKLGVAQMDWKIWGGANGLENGKKKTNGGIVNIFQIYDYHSIYISITIYFKYDFFYYNTVHFKPPYTILY